MTLLNFPSTAGKPTDGSFTYTANGVIYSWDGEKWTANSEGGLDTTYVQVAGDTMTGDLTVPNLIANAELSVASSQFKVLSDGQVEVGPSQTPAIYLKPDGTAEFRGQKISGGLFQIAYTNNGPTKCQYEFAPTAFYFGNGITKNSGGDYAAIILQADGAISFGSGNFTVAAAGDTRCKSGDAWTLGSSGNANFNGTVTSQNSFFNLEPENSANYVSTTNAEGETEAVYNGPTLDVKDSLTKLIAAVTAIRAASQVAGTLEDLKSAITTATADFGGNN